MKYLIKARDAYRAFVTGFLDGYFETCLALAIPGVKFPSPSKWTRRVLDVLVIFGVLWVFVVHEVHVIAVIVAMLFAICEFADGFHRGMKRGAELQTAISERLARQINELPPGESIHFKSKPTSMTKVDFHILLTSDFEHICELAGLQLKDKPAAFRSSELSDDLMRIAARSKK